MISRIIEGRGRGYLPKPMPDADNLDRDLDYSGYHKKPNIITVLLYTERKKIGHDSKWTDNLFLNV